MLVYFLIVFFLLLIIYQFLSYNKIVEGVENSGEYQDYSGSDVSTLAHQNAGNISVLKSQLDNLAGVKDQVKKNTDDIGELQTQVNALAQANTAKASDMTKTTPAISGT